MKKRLYYILNATWGLPMTLVGWVAYVCLRAVGLTPQSWGGCTWFCLGEGWGGLNLGLVIITDKDADENILNHEFGHSIQNARYGFFFPFAVAIPSVIRYWQREIDAKNGKTLEPYNSVWFEGEATKLGNRYIGYFN